MTKAQKRLIIIISVIAGLLMVGSIWFFQIRNPASSPRGEQYAEKRAREMAAAANANNPDSVYDYLTEELRSLCSRQEFAANWMHSRVFPRLMPPWLFIRGVVLLEDGTGAVTYERAMRVLGQSVSYAIVYENGGYYFEAFREIADGSFQLVPQQLSLGQAATATSLS